MVYSLTIEMVGSSTEKIVQGAVLGTLGVVVLALSVYAPPPPPLRSRIDGAPAGTRRQRRVLDGTLLASSHAATCWSSTA